MNTEIGKTLREARIRQRVDLAQVEAETKIRVRYLRALENEEWGVLPGGAYSRSFIRTYANHLGLDGERLADDFRRRVEDPVGERYPHAEPAPARRPAAGGPGARLEVSRGALAVLISIGLIALLIGIGLAGGDGDEGESPGGASGPQVGGPDRRQDGRGGEDQSSKRPQRVSVRLTALADVWVCLLDAGGTPLVDGQILGPGAEKGPFRSPSFMVAFGNGQVEIEIGGRGVDVEDTPNPVGYEIGLGGQLRPLTETERPLCL